MERFAFMRNLTVSAHLCFCEVQLNEKHQRCNRFAQVRAMREPLGLYIISA